MSTTLIDNKANLATANASDSPPGNSTLNPASTTANASVHPDHLPSNPTETTKTDANTSEALTDPTGPDGQLPNQPKKNTHQNLAGIILEALQDEVDHNKASPGSSRQESVASRMLSKNNTPKGSGVVSPQSNSQPSQSPQSNSLQSSAVTSTSDVSTKTPIGTSTPTNKKDEASVAVDKANEPAPPTDTPKPKKHDGPVQKYSPLITAAPGTHTAPPGSAMGAPPKTEKTSRPATEGESKFHEEMDGKSRKPDDTLHTTSHKKDAEKDGEGKFVTSGTKDGNAKKTAGPHHHDILNKLDPRVDSDRDGSRTIGGHGKKGVAV